MDRLVVVGASQGGVHALRTLVSGLPRDFPAPILIVLHTGPSPSILPAILTDLHRLPAAHATDGDRLQAGEILIAPPGQHLLVVDGKVELSGGPRENWARPAIDPLFRTAAEAYGPATIGVLLTGQLNDGVSGLFEIKRRGGVVIVQDPDEAEAPSMPQNALRNVDVDHCLPVGRIAGELARLARIPVSTPPGEKEMADTSHEFDKPTAQTCPECGGAMREETQGSLTRYRCHIGHVMTSEVVAASQLENLQECLGGVLRTLNERVALCLDQADKHVARGEEGRGAEWRRAADEAAGRIDAVRAVEEASWLHPEASEETVE